jgi:6-phosphogluconolactonase (cycloisomerase 2 family)
VSVVPAAALLLALTAALAIAVPGSLTFVDQYKDGLTVEGLDGATHLAVSPDGRHVYAASFVDDSVIALSRNTGTGTLSFVQQLQDGIGGVDGLDGAAGVAISPDGKHVYVTGEEEDAIAAFSREPVTGALSFIAFLQDGAAGVDGLDQASGVATSPDGGSVYATGRGDDAIATFARDPATGRLAFVGQERDGVGGVDGLDAAEVPASSPDGRNVYVAGAGDNAVAVFSRDPATGALGFIGAVKDGAGGVDGLEAAQGATVSPDGKHVYVTGNTDDAVVAFARDPLTGALTVVDQDRDGVDGVDGLDGAVGVVASPDGAQVYVVGEVDDAIATFARDQATGALTFVEQDKDGVDGVNGLDGAFDVDVACDGRGVYATAAEDDAVAAFAREGGAPGTCAPDLELDAAKQRLRRYVRGSATCGDEACTVEVEGKLKGAGGGLRLKPDTAEVAFQEDEPLALKLGRKVRRKAKEARREGRKVLAKLVATAEDLAGNEAEPEKIKIKLK